MNNPFEEIESRLAKIEKTLESMLNPPPPQVDEFIDVYAVAALLNLKTSTVYTKVHKGELPNHKRNGRLYFLKSEIIDYIKKGSNTFND